MAVFTVEALSNTYCSADPGVDIALSGSETGVNYQLKRDGIDDGSPLPGTGSVSVTEANSSVCITKVNYDVQLVDNVTPVISSCPSDVSTPSFLIVKSQSPVSGTIINGVDNTDF